MRCSGAIPTAKLRLVGDKLVPTCFPGSFRGRGSTHRSTQGGTGKANIFLTLQCRQHPHLESFSAKLLYDIMHVIAVQLLGGALFRGRKSAQLGEGILAKPFHGSGSRNVCRNICLEECVPVTVPHQIIQRMQLGWCESGASFLEIVSKWESWPF